MLYSSTAGEGHPRSLITALWAAKQSLTRQAIALRKYDRIDRLVLAAVELAEVQNLDQGLYSIVNSDCVRSPSHSSLH